MKRFHLPAFSAPAASGERGVEGEGGVELHQRAVEALEAGLALGEREEGRGAGFQVGERGVGFRFAALGTAIFGDDFCHEADAEHEHGGDADGGGPASARAVPASRSRTLKRGTTLLPPRESAPSPNRCASTPSLQYIAVGFNDPYRPVAEFSADYDAQQAAGKK